MRLLLLFFLSCLTLYSESIHGIVMDVIDGDTITIMDYDQNEHKIRLYGIDAPEMDQFGGVTARNNLTGILTNENGESSLIYSAVEVKNLDIDQYGRIVGKVYKNGVYLNRVMLERGQAWTDERYLKKEDNDLRKAEEGGKEKKLSFIHPREFRKLSKEDKKRIEHNFFTVALKNGIEVSCVSPYVVMIKNNKESFMLAPCKNTPVYYKDYPYPYGEEILIKTLNKMNILRELLDNVKLERSGKINSDMYYGDVFFVKSADKNYTMGLFKSICEAGYFDHKMIVDYAEHAIKNNSQKINFFKRSFASKFSKDEDYKKFIGENHDISQNVKKQLKLLSEEGIKSKYIPITPVAWNNMNQEMRDYLIGKIYGLKSSEIILDEDENQPSDIPAKKNKELTREFLRLLLKTEGEEHEEYSDEKGNQSTPLTAEQLIEILEGAKKKIEPNPELFVI